MRPTFSYLRRLLNADLLHSATPHVTVSGRYVLEGPGHIFDRSGREIPATAVKLGTPVRVVYAQVGGTLTVDYIVVEG